MSTLTRISSRIVILPATHKTDRPLLAAIQGTSKTVLMDAGNSPTHAREFLQRLAVEAIRPDVLVLTHHHWDHTFGVGALHIPIVAHVNTRRHLEEMQTWSWTDAALAERVEQRRQTAFTAANIQKEWGDDRNVILRLPTVTYTDEFTLNLGDTTCMLIHPAVDHADDCTLLYVPEERTLFLGDAFYADTMTWTYSLAGAVGLVNALEGLEIDQCFLSHEDEPWDGPVFHDWLRVMKQIIQAIPAIAVTQEPLEAAVARGLGRSLNEEESEVVGYFTKGLRTP